jgi:monoterpene epsilon-lactone hydrolase
MPKETAKRLLKIIKLKGSGRAETVERARKGLESFYLRFHSIKDVVVEDVFIGHIPAFWISAPGTLKDRTILFFHGGGFMVGSTKDHLDLCGKLSLSSGCRVLSIDYRLAPEHIFPAALDDCTDAYQWLINQGINPREIIPAGISAGGNLIVSMFFRLRAAGVNLPRAAVLISPAVNLASSGNSRKTNAQKDWITAEGLDLLKKAYLRKHDPKDPFASPTYGDLRSLPPLFVQAGAHEVLLDDVSDFVRKAREAGVDVTFDVWEGMFHCWQIFSSVLPEGQQAIDNIGAYIREKFRAG